MFDGAGREAEFEKLLKSHGDAFKDPGRQPLTASLRERLARSLARPTPIRRRLGRWEPILDIQEHFTDTGGASDHVFGRFAQIGKRFAPRLRNLTDQKSHTFDKGDAYTALSNHIGAPINATMILDHWDDPLSTFQTMRAVQKRR